MQTGINCDVCHRPYGHVIRPGVVRCVVHMEKTGLSVVVDIQHLGEGNELVNRHDGRGPIRHIHGKAAQ